MLEKSFDQVYTKFKLHFYRTVFGRFQKREATLIVISHPERISDLADEIVMIRDGKIAKHGPKDEIFPQILANTSAGCSYMSEGAR